MRILLVDDEIATTTRLTRSLEHEPDLQVFVSNSCAEGLEFLHSDPTVDVVICETLMPDMDGATFLKTVRERHPTCLRLALCGEADQAAGLRMMNHAHQILAKTCSSADLRHTIMRAEQTRALLEAPAVKALLGRIDKFPKAPGTAAALSLLIESETATLAEIAAVVERDAALSAKVLQLTNSAFFSFASPTTSVSQAVTRLGVDVVRSLALSTGMLEKIGGATLALDLDALNGANVQASILARRLVSDAGERDLVASAAMLAHLGVIAICACDSERWAAMMPDPSDWRSRPEQEEALYGCTHAQVGAYLLALWGLPMRIVNLVLRHHEVLLPPEGRIDAQSAVVAACAVMENGELPAGWEKAPPLARFSHLISGFAMSD